MWRVTEPCSRRWRAVRDHRLPVASRSLCRAIRRRAGGNRNCRPLPRSCATLFQNGARGHLWRAAILIHKAMAAWSALLEVGLARIAAQESRFFELAARDFGVMAKAGAAMPAAACAGLIEALLDFRVEAARAFDVVDVIMTPANAAPAWGLETHYPPVIAGTKVGPRGHAVFTGWVNACGHPAIALPGPPAASGMPIGSSWWALWAQTKCCWISPKPMKCGIPGQDAGRPGSTDRFTTRSGRGGPGRGIPRRLACHLPSAASGTRRRVPPP